MDKVCSLEAALAALGAEDVAAKTEVDAALERAREGKPAAQSNQQARWSPDAVLEHARCKVRRFEEALKAMGDMQDPEVEFLQDALKRLDRQFRSAHWPARCPSVEGSSSVQNVDWRRSMWNAQQSRLSSTRHEVVSLEAQAAVLPPDMPRQPVVDVSVELELVSNELERDEALSAPNRSGSPRHPTSDSRSVRACRFVSVNGRSPCGVVRGHLDWGSGPHPEAHVHDGRVRRTVGSVDQLQDILRIVNSRYGLRGVRVGEASHPGPASKRRRTQRLRGVPWSWDSDGESRPTQVDSDSEDESLVRPVRVPPDVVEALEHNLCEGCLDPATTQLSSTVLASVVPTTVPASPGAFREVHRVAAVPPRFGRRVVLVPGSPDATPHSQGAPSSLMRNRFAVLADETAFAAEG